MNVAAYPLTKNRKKRLQARRALQRAGHVEFKPDSSAKWVNITRSWKGKVLVQIEHDNVKNCTPEMILWWFENLARTTTWNGEDFTGPEVTLYHLWHHRDHNSVTPVTDAPNGEKNHGFLEGAISIIDERFNEVHFHVKNKMLVKVLNEWEFSFDVKMNGIKFGRLAHYYSPAEDGSNFFAETEIGFDMPVIGWIFNWLVLPFIYNKQTAWYWVRHNIEETGCTEDVLPVLYTAFFEKWNV